MHSGMEKSRRLIFVVMFFAAEGLLRVATRKVYETLGFETFPVPSGPDLEGVEEFLLEKFLAFSGSLCMLECNPKKGDTEGWSCKEKS